MRSRGIALLALCAVACGDDGGTDAGPVDAGMDGMEPRDAARDAGPPPPPPPPVPPPPDMTPTLASKALGFRLYYRERVERAIVAYNRYGLFGDSTAATNIGNAAVARTGTDHEVVPGPKDNNRIGTDTWSTYHAYRAFRSRPLALTLIRQLDGLAMFEAIPGHPGLTSREVYPGWTRVMDGIADTVTRTRGGAPISSPMPGSAAVEREVLDTFFDGVRFTYREDPAELLFAFKPAFDVTHYAITHSFSELPDYLRVSDCCSSLMRTPAGHPWEGAFWGNHNSRDNWPDLVLGFLAARAVADDEEADDDVRAAARRAIAAGERVGDLVVASRSSLMTFDEHNPYGTLVVGGTVRPHGDPENQDLGSLGVCTMAYLGQAISTGGLSLPEPELALPGSTDRVFFGGLGAIVECELPEGDVICRSIDQSFCGKDWSTFHQIRFLRQPIIEYFRENPESAPPILASFQNDFDDIVESGVALLHYARLIGNDAMIDEARSTVFYLTWLQQEMADLSFPDRPDRRAEYRYLASLYRAQSALPPDEADLDMLSPAEADTASLESLLAFGETSPAALLTDEEIRTRIEAELDGGRESVVERYRAEYGMTPPLRRAGDGYEARGTPLAEHPWTAVERPHHRGIGSPRLLQGIVLCEHAPQVVDCSWARLGCARPDLDASRTVDGADDALFDAARTAHEGMACSDGNMWCAGADLDRDGTAGGDDAAFMDAAAGCTY